MYTHESGSNKLTRSDYFYLMAASWHLLYTPDWPHVTIPDLQTLLQTRGDIRTDSPSALEDIQRVLTRLGIVPCAVSPADRSLDPASHMSHTDIYSSILSILLSFKTSKAQVLKLSAYSTKNVYSFREKQLVYGLIPQLVKAQVLDLGHAVDDNILQEIGRSCSIIRRLSIAGAAISDCGLKVLCEEGDKSGLTRTLSSLTLQSTVMVTLPGLLTCLDHLHQLTDLSVQESLLLQILRSAEGGERIIPVMQLELTLGPARRDYLQPASKIFPHILHLTLWCFESENVSSLSSFVGWSNFTRLSSLSLNNIANCDFLEIIEAVGEQLTNIDIDNFSNDESDLQIYLDLNLIGKFCPKIHTLSVSMAFVDFKPNLVFGSIFQNLTTLTLRGNKYRSQQVLTNLLFQVPRLVKLSVELKASRTAEVESEVLSDKVMVELLSNNALHSLEQIILNTLDHPHGIGCKINLTDLSLTYLLSHCQRLELIGDLSRWSLVDTEETEKTLRRDWAWTKYT